MPLATYVPQEVIVTAGSHIVGGWGVTARINIEQVDQTFTTISGTDLTSRSLTYTGLYMATLTLQQTSESNDEFSRLHDLDVQTRSGYFEFGITDASGTSKMMSPNAYIQTMPTQENAVEVGTREWLLVCPDVTGMVVGGNTTV